MNESQKQDNSYNPLSITEDFTFPAFGIGMCSRVQTLPKRLTACYSPLKFPDMVNTLENKSSLQVSADYEEFTAMVDREIIQEYKKNVENNYDRAMSIVKGS